MRGPQLKPTDVAGLSDLSLQMQSCALTLDQLGYKADVNCSDNLIKVVKRLPVHLQSKWADRAGTLILSGTDPTFFYLAKFVQERALLSNTTYRELVGSTPNKDQRNSKVRPKARSYTSQERAITMAMHSHMVNDASSVCPFCAFLFVLYVPVSTSFQNVST